MTSQSQSTLTGIRFKTDRNKWEARVCLQGKTLSKVFSTVDEAVAWRKSMLEPKAVETVLTCADLFPKWLESLKNDPDFSPQSYNLYSSNTKVHLLNFFGKMKLQEILDVTVIKFAVYLKDFVYKGKTLSAKTIKCLIGCLSNFFEYCCVRGYILINPSKLPLFRQNLARLVKERNKFERNIREKARTTDEIQLLLTAGYQKSFEFGFIIEFMLSTAIRLGEAAALNWGDLLSANNGFFVILNKTRDHRTKNVQSKTKWGSDGSVPLNHVIIERLEQWKLQLVELGYGIEKTDAIFPSLARNPIGFSESLEVLSRKIEIRRTTAHCLRHSSLTFLASNGHDLQQVQKFARHSSINMTRSYFAASHLQLEQMTKTMEKLTLNAVPI